MGVMSATMSHTALIDINLLRDLLYIQMDSICADALDMFPSETRFISYRKRTQRVYIEVCEAKYIEHAKRVYRQRRKYNG